MATKNTQLALVVPEETVTALAEAVSYGESQNLLPDTIHRTYGVATAVSTLTNLLTPKMMEPIMALQNSPLGFLTDQRGAGYPVDVVRTALIQSLIEGLEPVGNQWNILAGRMYVTKNGMARKLSRIPGLLRHVTPGIPRNAGEKGAIVPVHVEWTYNGETHKADLEFAVKINNGMGVDALIGKATRKALAWLYEEITGNSVPEGEVGDSAPIDITPKASPLEQPQVVESDALEAM